jgi:hypothetical protein
MSGKIFHQLKIVTPTCEARLVPSEFVPRVHLGRHQGKGGSTVNAMESDLPGTHRDIMKTTHHQVASGIQSPGSIARCPLEGF